MKAHQTIKNGIIAALISNLLFGILYIYSHWMLPMSGTKVFAWRMVAMLGGLWVILMLTGSYRDFTRFIVALGKDIQRWSMMIVGTLIVGSQLWLFMWGPVNGQGVNVAMGYFLFPLAMIIGGWLFLRENVNRYQWIAVALAATGVIYELSVTGSFSWATVWVFTTYPIYYLSRRKMKIPALIGLTFDLCLIAPVALFYLVYQADGLTVLSYVNRYWLLIPLLGIISAAAMQLNLTASHFLPVTLFGLFSYLEPFLLFLIALLFFDTATLSTNHLITYGFIWAGLLVAITDTLRLLHRQAHFSAPSGKPQDGTVENQKH